MIARPQSAPVAVIGAGLAGLTAAWSLARRGIDVVVFESGKRVGGLASSQRDAEGFSYDIGAHFITNRLAAAIGVSADCRDVAEYGEAVFLRGRSYAYPFGLAAEPRFLAGALFACFVRDRRPANAAQWFERRVGTALAREVALPLMEAWSGLPAERLSAAVGATLPTTARSLYLALARRLTGRPIASGYSRTAPEGASVWHVYPKEGVATLCRRLAESIGERIELESPVEEVVVRDGAVHAIRVRGVLRDVSAVVSTLPLDVLGRVVTGTDALAPLRRFRYRPMTFVNLRFEGRNLLPAVVQWTPERRFRFFRLTEAPRAMPWLAPEGKTSITADIGCEVGDSTWTAPDDVLAAEVLAELRQIVPESAGRFLGAFIVRTPCAYPVFDLAYEAERIAAERSLGISGLASVGRNGTFAHVFMEDVYWQTLAATRPLAELALVTAARGG